MSAANRLSGVYNHHSISTMLCGRCGATLPPGSDRCAVCHTRTVTAEDAAITGPGLQATYPDTSETVSAPTVEASGHELATTAPGLHAPFPGLSHQTAGPTVAGPAMGGAVLPPGQQFGPRYTIIRLLGSGGMASVYQAWDETLGTAVALKLIRVDATTPREELRQLEDRFKRELKLARQVTHPNVVRIHDLGEVDSTLYLTMEYVQGADLATLLQREPRLPLPRVLLLARQIAAGLAAAHKAGIVHRDLKPANVMVDAQDHALLMDFGIARSTSGSDHQYDAGLADRHARLHGAGTGAGRTGRRADRRLCLWPDPLRADRRRAAALQRRRRALRSHPRLEKGPPPLKSLQPDVPAALDQIVAKCLQPAAAARYASADELLADLEALDEQGRSRCATAFPHGSGSRRPRPRRRAHYARRGGWRAGAEPPPPPAAAPPLPVLIVDFENRASESVFEGALEQALSIAMEGAPFVTAYPRRDAANMARDLKWGQARREDRTARRPVAGHSRHPGRDDRAERRRLSRAGPPARARQTGAGVGGAGRRPDKAQSSARWRASRRTCARRSATRRRRARNRRKRSPPRRWTRCAPTRCAGSVDQPAGRGGGRELSRSAALRPRVRPRLFGPGGKPVPPGKPRRSGEVLERGAAPHRSHDRARKAADIRRVLRRHRAKYDKAIETYKQLVAKYPADSAGHNNLAIAYFNTLNFAKALEYGRKAIDIYPRTFKYRSNYALYAMYAGDFKTAAATAQELIKEDPKVESRICRWRWKHSRPGMSRGRAPRMQQVKQAGDSGVSLSALGIADIAMYEGRYDEAIAILPAAAKRDQDQQNILGAVSKLVALAEAYQARGNDAARQTSIAQARALSTQENVLVPAARLAIAAGRPEEARKIAAELAQRLPAQSRAYAKMIEGEIAIAAKQYAEAIDALNAAQKLRGPLARPLRAGPRLLQSWRLPRGRLGIREVPRAARRGDGGVPRRPADLPLLRAPALLARARARDAEARRAARSSRSSCASARAPPAIRWSRTRGDGSNPPRTNLSLGSPPALNDWRAVRFRRLPSPSPTRRQS